jgi:hypothetical protein
MSATTTPALATTALVSAVMVHMRHVGPAVESVKHARTAVFEADDLTDGYMATARLILALEALEDTSKQIAADARKILRDRMATDGCYSHGAEDMTITLADAPRTAQITDMKALMAAHPELVTTPDPQPDRKAIADLLRKGRSVEGAHLSNGGDPVLKLITKKAK